MVLLGRNINTGRLYRGSGGKLCRGCCGGGGTWNCGEWPESVTVTISGVADCPSCGESWYPGEVNGTYVLPRLGSTDTYRLLVKIVSKYGSSFYHYCEAVLFCDWGSDKIKVNELRFYSRRESFESRTYFYSSGSDLPLPITGESYLYNELTLEQCCTNHPGIYDNFYVAYGGIGQIY